MYGVIFLKLSYTIVRSTAYCRWIRFQKRDDDPLKFLTQFVISSSVTDSHMLRSVTTCRPTSILVKPLSFLQKRSGMYCHQVCGRRRKLLCDRRLLDLGYDDTVWPKIGVEANLDRRRCTMVIKAHIELKGKLSNGSTDMGSWTATVYKDICGNSTANSDME